MQIDFSVTEGGFDAGFLTFKQEPDFLRKLFRLTADAQQTIAVRETVAKTCDKLRRKPEYDRRLAELTKLQASFTVFSEAIAFYRSAKAAVVAARIRCAYLVDALTTRAARSARARQMQLEAEAVQRECADSANRDLVVHEKAAVILEDALRQRRLAAAQATLKERKAAEETAAREIRFVKAARAQADIEAQVSTLNQLESSVGELRKGLAPFRDMAELHGALLRRALFDAERAKRGEITAIADQDESRTAEERAKVKEKADCEKRIRNLQEERGRLGGTEEAYGTQREIHVREGALDGDAEPTTAAIERWQNEAATRQREKAAAEAEARNAEAEANTCQQVASAASGTIAKQEGEVRKIKGQLDAANQERQRIAQLQILALATDSEVVDPDAGVLPGFVEGFITTCAREISACDVRLAEHVAIRQAIDETGVAAYNPDVRLVTNTMREQGLLSAKPFNEYLAQAIPSAGVARAIVNSNPARFMGVCVAAAEMELVELVEFEHQPDRPVVVSVADIDPDRLNEGFWVIPVSSDGA
jgi:hypothetical protein